MAIFLWIAVVLVVLAIVIGATVRWRRATEKRLITCPETGTPHAVELDPARHLKSALIGGDERLRDCSRWPERADCDQPCLSQIAASPDDCRLRKILDGFYASRNCVLCGKDFGQQIDWWQHEPGLVDADQHVLTWKDFPPEQLQEVLDRSRPVCWDCKVVAKVVQEHPERVTHRPAH